MDEDAIGKKIRLAGGKAREKSWSKGVEVIYEDDEGNLIKEYSDGTIKKQVREEE
ncbi:hypothetical protein [Thalassobacillus sp. C254]|uniref:hypothetical protein n=1 Tax=Thalassobacillus sp. C254 TaxID=1225341 RepID=UPI0012ECC0F7|nr:hypothetical protein [Thalassobacillus sp. C254]